MLSAIDRIHCPPSNGMPVRHHRNPHLPEKIAYRLDSRYFILVLAGKAIGLGFFTYDYTTKLLYGNYIAVHECWRSGDIADAFVGEAIHILEELFPEYQGIVFEVEKYNPIKIRQIIEYLEELKVVTKNLDGSKAFQSEGDRDEIRRFLRVCWYQKVRCRFFSSGETEEPISYTAPCLDPGENLANWAHMEENYWLMWLPRDGSDIADPKSLFERAIQCIYV